MKYRHKLKNTTYNELLKIINARYKINASEARVTLTGLLEDMKGEITKDRLISYMNELEGEVK